LMARRSARLEPNWGAELRHELGLPVILQGGDS